MQEQSMTLTELLVLVGKALVKSGAGHEAARLVSQSLVRSEAEGNTACGLHYVPILCEQLQADRINGTADPVVSCPASGAVVVDAQNGFAHLAIARGTPALIDAARNCGVGVMSVNRSTNALALSHLVLPLAEAGLIGLALANAPASIAPPGGAKPVLGTNPLAFAVPRADGPPMVLDQSASAVTKTKVMMHRDRGEAIPEGWAIDRNGQPTTDPEAGLLGSMAPAGGHKGFGIALVVEVLAAALSGAHLSASAAPFTGDKGGPSATGQCLIAIDPGHFGDGFSASFSELAHSLTQQPNTRLPGVSRLIAYAAAQEDGISVDGPLIARITTLLN